MKSHFTVEQFFHPRFRAQLGVTLALLRVAFAYALASSALCLHAAMPETLVRLKVQVVPFLEAFATAWNFSWWRGVIIVAGIAFGLGLFTRTTAAILLLFFIGVAVIDYSLLGVCLGAWAGVAFLLLLASFFSHWGKIFGLDEFIERLGFFSRKRHRRGLLF